MAAFIDNCRFIPTAGGTTDWTYSSAVGGCQSPSAAGAVNGTKYKYRAESSDLTQWELGEGTYNTTTGVLARTTVLYNSSGTGTASGQSGAGTKINFSTTPQVAVVALAEDSASPVILRGYLSGLGLSTPGSSSTFSVAAGVATDGGNTDFMLLGSSISKTTGAWAVGSGNGALDTGTIANSTWYHVHLIKRPDTQVVDVLISLSATAPTLPANYTLSRRLGSMKTNASGQWVLFHQLGDEFLWDAPIQEANGVSVPTTATLLTLAGIPTGVQVLARLRGYGAGSAANGLVMQSPDEASAIGNATNGNLDIIWGAGGQSGANFIVRVNTFAQVRWSAAASGATAAIVSFGWIDRRGRDA